MSLGGMILVPLTPLSIVCFLGFSNISHYLFYCEGRSKAEEVFCFPLGLFPGHCLAARQSYQSLLPKALFWGLEILRCWRSGGVRYIGRTLYLHLALFWVLANALSLLPKRNSYYGIDFLTQKIQGEWLLVKCNSRKCSSLLFQKGLCLALWWMRPVLKPFQCQFCTEGRTNRSDWYAKNRF